MSENMKIYLTLVLCFFEAKPFKTSSSTFFLFAEDGGEVLFNIESKVDKTLVGKGNRLHQLGFSLMTSDLQIRRSFGILETNN